MTTSDKYLLWDFDGTLAHRPGQWTDTVITVLREEGLANGIDRESVRPFMNAGFPWHEPEVIRMYTAAEEWWRMLEPVLARAFQHVGQVSYARAVALAQRVRGTYLDASAWIVFDDTAPALIQLSARAWRHVVLSNHVPELPQLAGALGLAHHFESIHTSGVTGVEKPNAEAYRRVRATLPVTATVWMIGDSVHADVLGAESVGIPAILVRNTSAHVARSCVDLMGVLDIVEAGVP